MQVQYDDTNVRELEKERKRPVSFAKLSSGKDGTLEGEGGWSGWPQKSKWYSAVLCRHYTVRKFDTI